MFTIEEDAAALASAFILAHHITTATTLTTATAATAARFAENVVGATGGKVTDGSVA